MDSWVCPEATRHDPKRDGRCRWCNARCDSAVPAPREYPTSTAELAYRYHFDPDFGSGKWDVYE